MHVYCWEGEPKGCRCVATLNQIDVEVDPRRRGFTKLQKNQLVGFSYLGTGDNNMFHKS